VPNYGHHVPMPTHLGTQNAEAVLGIVVGDALARPASTSRSDGLGSIFINPLLG
jgi:hypothetical protein